MEGNGWRAKGGGESAGWTAVSGALAAKCSRQKLCGSFAMAGRATDDAMNAMANSKCSANFNWPGPFVYPFVLIYLHVICFHPPFTHPLPHNSPVSISYPFLTRFFQAFLLIFLCFSFLLFQLFLAVGSRLSARMPVTYGCYVHYQYALCGSSCRFILSQRFSPTFPKWVIQIACEG